MEGWDGRWSGWLAVRAVLLLGIILQSCGGEGSDPTPPADSGVLAVNDPLFPSQWHLSNTGQQGGVPGEDIRISSAWARAQKGTGIRIHVTDDGMETAHEDLAPNVLSGQSYNFLNITNGCGQQYQCTPNGRPANDPAPTRPDHNHGTAVSGVAAASGNNLGGRGAAPSAQLVGYNLTAFNSQDSTDAVAMIHNGMFAHINNNSWGPTDGTGQLIDAGPLWKTAVQNGVVTGRAGLGTLYTWAAGNGGTNLLTDNRDNSNYDGYANYRYVLAICAVNAQGRKARYSEKGANLLVCAPSSDDDLPGITTTDRTGTVGYNTGSDPDNITDADYTNGFGGTSAATPLVTGVIALVLQANPNLTWRDVRLLLAETARRNDPGDSDWAEFGLNSRGARYHHNHKYGFGVIDAEAATQRALTWTNVGPLRAVTTARRVPNIPITDNSATGVSDTLSVSASGITHIEFIEVTFSASDHTYFGDLEVVLRNVTTGTLSQLSEQHLCFRNESQTRCSPSFNSWTFGVTRHLGESADAEWRLEVRDLNAQDIGTFEAWRLTFYGS